MRTSEWSGRSYVMSVMISLLLFGSTYSRTFTVPSEDIKTIQDGLVRCKKGDTVVVKPGTYNEILSIGTGITLISQEINKAIIDGKKKGDVVTLTYNSMISGFEIRNGIVGVFSRGPNNCIEKCKIYLNRSSGIVCTSNLPVLQNNFIIYNQGSGIQALDISTGSGTGSINHNTIAYNGNHGITIESIIQLQIENNIIAFNSGQAIKVNDGKLFKIVNNDFFENHQLSLISVEGNYLFDPLFLAPHIKTLDFFLKNDSPALRRANDGKNLGVDLSE